MPKLGYKQTPEHKEKTIKNLIMGGQTGKHWKIKDTINMKGRHPKSEFKKNDERLLGNKNREGYVPWNKGLKGLIIPWNKGKKVSEMSGANNPSWKGGITSKDRIERVKFRKQMQKIIFERDDYTCQMCGVRGVDLQVDHIQSWAEYVNLRFNINNCRTLCKKCHYFITFGKEMVNKDMPWGHNLRRRVAL